MPESRKSGTAENVEITPGCFWAGARYFWASRAASASAASLIDS
jgi:hypothetical protein